jgi:DNA-nicking Smr family endonuclease
MHAHFSVVFSLGDRGKSGDAIVRSSRRDGNACGAGLSKHDNKTSDLDLLREAFSDVRPLSAKQRSDSRAPPPEPRARQLEKDEAAVKAELLELPDDPVELETGEELMFLRPGYQNRYLVRLRRGRYSISDSIDLHSMNESTAASALLAFIDHAAATGMGCVRVVHGKGLRSRGMPKLKAMTRRLLSRHPQVIAFASCRPVDGGTGAVSVLLKATLSGTARR